MPVTTRRRATRTRLALMMAAGGLLALATPNQPATAAPPVTVAVTSTGTDTAGYRIEVRNETGATVETTLRQELPPGATPVSISDGGRSATPPGQTGGTEVSWRLSLIAGGTATVRTQLAQTPPDVPVTAPACAFAGDGTLPYDCASATWRPATMATEATAAPPWWRRAPALLAGVALLVLIATGTAGWAWWRRRREIRSSRSSRSPAESAASAGTPRRPAGARFSRPASGGAVYRAGSFGGPQLIRDEPPVNRDEPLAQPGGGAAGGPIGGPVGGPVGAGEQLVGGQWRPGPVAPPRSRPPTWLAVALAAVLAVGLAATVIATASTQVTAIGADQEPSSGAWIGRTVAGQVGAPLRDSAFEFTVYRLACPDPAGAGDGSRCQVTVGLHNVSGRDQHWSGSLQRAYLPGGDWVTVDETATLAANAGRDYFAAPVPPGDRMVFPLVFTLPTPVAPTRIELRSEVFSAGVSVDVPR